MVAFPGQRPNLLLELDLTEPLVAPEADDPIARLRARGRRLLRPTLRALHEAAEDRHVVGLVAKVGGVWPGTMQELRLGVQAFAASGKPTLAWAESFGEGSARDMAAYVLATAGELWLQPGGGVGLAGRRHRDDLRAARSTGLALSQRWSSATSTRMRPI